MTWIITILWTISVILTGKIAYAIGWRDCMAALEQYIVKYEEAE